MGAARPPACERRAAGGDHSINRRRWPDQRVRTLAPSPPRANAIGARPAGIVVSMQRSSCRRISSARLTSLSSCRSVARAFRERSSIMRRARAARSSRTIIRFAMSLLLHRMQPAPSRSLKGVRRRMPSCGPTSRCPFGTSPEGPVPPFRSRVSAKTPCATPRRHSRVECRRLSRHSDQAHASGRSLRAHRRHLFAQQDRGAARHAARK